MHAGTGLRFLRQAEHAELGPQVPYVTRSFCRPQTNEEAESLPGRRQQQSWGMERKGCSARLLDRAGLLADDLGPGAVRCGHVCFENGDVDMIEFFEFRLDTLNQCLWRAGVDDGDKERISIPPKAFAVLRYLVEHPGRLVTEDELLNAVWPKVYVQPEAIKGQLHEIRKFLGDDAKHPRFIETLPRRGYQFIAPVRVGSSVVSTAATKPTHGRLVGRERELLELREHLRAALNGQQQVVFVTGEPGIGKSALVDEFLRLTSIEVPAIRIARAQCIEAHGDTEAYYPILEALGQLCRGAAAGSIVEILATQAPTWLVQFPDLLTKQHREMLGREILGATRERMLREIGAAFDAIAAKFPLLLVLEDLQWVDPSTVDLISALARRRAPATRMLIATKRPIDDMPSAQALMALKRELLVHQLCQEIALNPWGEAEVAEYLVAESSQGDAPEAFARLLYQHTEGNPLFMVAALDHLMQRGFISRENGTWQLKVPLDEVDLGVPETLRQMIEAQINRLSKMEQLALEAASVQGAAFSTSICASVINGDAEGYETLYESMARRGRVVRAAGIDPLPGGAASVRCKFVHAMYREVLYDRQSLRRRSTLHQRIGERLEALYSTQLHEVASKLAHHFEASADWPRAIKYLRLAAEAAERRCGHQEAIALLQRALASASRLPAERRSLAEIEILEVLASILYMSLEISASAFEALASHAAQCGVVDVEVRALTETGILWSWSDSKRALELLDRADLVNARQADSLARAEGRVKCTYGRMLNGRCNATDARECCNAMLELRNAGLVQGHHLSWYSRVLLTVSDYREARRYALEGLALLAPGSPVNPCANRSQINAGYVLFNASMFIGELGEALRVIEATIAALTKNGNDAFACVLQFWRAWLSVVAQDFEGALAICQSGAHALGDLELRHLPAEHFRLVVTGTAEVALGRYELALEHLSLARHQLDRQPVYNDEYCNLLLKSALAELWLAKRDLAQASAHAQQFLETALGAEERTWQALAWDANARVAMATGDLVRGTECIAKALMTIQKFEVPLAEWRVYATAAALDDQLGNLESAKLHRQRSHATMLRIADSLPPEEPLRKTFLSSSPVGEFPGTSAPG